MSTFGWCQTRQHDQCPVKYQRWYNGQKRVKRKMVDAVIYLDEWRECDCSCHSPQPEKPVRKTRKRKT